tara:strand:+ start:19323 stop:20477 length:1155 start_codon:yes stop_codon:yes gene_type:complete
LKVLFISHESSRTGAPLVLLSFLKWLKQNQSDIACDLVSLKTGELREEFENVVDSYQELLVETPEELTLIQQIKKRLKKRIGLHKPIKSKKNLLIESLKTTSFDIIYANTALALDLAIKIKKRNPAVKVICHIHELNTIIKLKVPFFRSYIPFVDRWIAVSNLVKNNLMSNYSIPPAAIKTIYEFTGSVAPQQRISSNDSEFIVGGCGTVHWRKGTDLFLLVALYVRRNYPQLPIKFIWVGEISAEQETIMDADIKKCNIAETVELIGSTENPSYYYNQMSLFLLTSREDPFPLVAIEAGKLGKPIIAFDKASGTTEVLSDTCGSVVNYLDVEAMAEQIAFYYKNQSVLKMHGKNAKAVFDQFSPNIICTQLYDVIFKVFETIK